MNRYIDLMIDAATGKKSKIKLRKYMNPDVGKPFRTIENWYTLRLDGVVTYSYNPQRIGRCDNKHYVIKHYSDEEVMISGPYSLSTMNALSPKSWPRKMIKMSESMTLFTKEELLGLGDLIAAGEDHKIMALQMIASAIRRTGAVQATSIKRARLRR